RIWTSHCSNTSGNMPYPGDNGPIIKANNQFEPHGHLSAQSLYNSYDIGCIGTHAHEVDNSNLTFVSFEIGFKHQSPFPITSLDLTNSSHWRNLPSAIFWC